MPIDSLEAAKALSRYLDVDHPILGLFDADLFLEDLCGYETRFCSELLVNSLLSWACVRDPSRFGLSSIMGGLANFPR